MGHIQVAAHSEPVFDARKHLEKVARLVAHQDIFCTTSRLERERKVFLCRTKRERRGGKGQFNRTGVECDAAHPSRIGGGDLWWVCEPNARKECEGSNVRVIFSKWLSSRKAGWAIAPATIDPSAARSSTNGAPKQ